MAVDEVPGLGNRSRQRLRNFGVGLKTSRVRDVLVFGLRTAAVNTIAAFTTEALNTYLESKGMNSRRIALLAIPNPDKPTPQNPLRRKLM